MVFINKIMQKIINLFRRKENNYSPLTLEEFYENNPIMYFYNYDGVSFTGCTVSDFEIYSSTLSIIKYHVPKPKRFKLKPKPKPKPKYYQDGFEVPFDSIAPDEYWEKREYDADGNEIYYENSRGYWKKWEYNDMGKPTNYINSSGHWYKYEYDVDGKIIYYEDSNGVIHE